MKKRTILLFLFITIFCFDTGFSQSKDNLVMENPANLSRLRLSLGYTELLPKNLNVSFEHFFFNFSYRANSFNNKSPKFKIKVTFEPGINGVLISDNHIRNKPYFYFLPYLKFGPEIKLGKNLFLGSSLGLILLSYKKAFFPLPFAGLNGFYLIRLNKKFSIEIESGFHTTYTGAKLPFLFYLTVGLSLL